MQTSASLCVCVCVCVCVVCVGVCLCLCEEGEERERERECCVGLSVSVKLVAHACSFHVHRCLTVVVIVIYCDDNFGHYYFPYFSQVMYVITRHITSLRKVYNYYSQLGYEESPDNTFTMTRMQFWRFVKDCCFHHNEVMLTEMDRFIGRSESFILFVCVLGGFLT